MHFVPSDRGFHHRSDGGDDDNNDENGDMVIGPGSSRKWIGLVAYVLFFLMVASVLVFLFVRLDVTLALAVAIVTFMCAYMLVMGWIASRNADRRDF